VIRNRDSACYAGTPAASALKTNLSSHKPQPALEFSISIFNWHNPLNGDPVLAMVGLHNG
jgi:hypothetical protein